jgi:predicted HTH domain antitoxin
MTLTFELNLHVSGETAGATEHRREAMESLAIEGFRSGAFTHCQASRMLGLSRFQFDGFLKDRHIHDHAYGVEDFVEDTHVLSRA